MKKSVGSILFVFVSCIYFFVFQNVGTLTDLDKLYLALAEVKKEHYFNTLCFGLGINSLNALENYTIGSDKAQSRIISSTDLADLKEELKNRLFSFYQLSEVPDQIHKGKNRISTSSIKAIPEVAKFGRATVISSFVFNK